MKDFVRIFAGSPITMLMALSSSNSTLPRIVRLIWCNIFSVSACGCRRLSEITFAHNRSSVVALLHLFPTRGVFLSLLLFLLQRPL